jgi:hypothetical protein
MFGASACEETSAGDTPQVDASTGTSTHVTGPIAPECTEPLDSCAQVDVDAVLACKDVDSHDFTITTRFSGKTDGVSCAAEDTGDGSHDLWMTLQPPQANSEAYNTHAVRFWLPNYAGPGRYELESLETGDFRNMGIWFQGATGGSQAQEKSKSANDEACTPSPCHAIVAEESEPVPHDPSGVQEFRVRVEVKCSAGGELWWHPDCKGNSRCTIEGEPTLKFDVQCAH